MTAAWPRLSRAIRGRAKDCSLSHRVHRPAPPGAAGANASGVPETLARHRGALKELFIVSQVAPLDPREAEDLRRKANGAEAFSVDGLYGRVLIHTPLIVVG